MIKFTNIYRQSVACVMAALALTSFSQLHEQISVEGKYVPEIIRVDRIYSFPKALRQTLSTSPIDYEIGGVTTSFYPSLLVMPATGWGATRQISDEPGYLELGAGSWLNSTLSAGYRFVENSTTLVGARLQFNSTSLWKPKLSLETADVKQERYDGAIGIYGSHVVKGYGRIDAAIDFHLGKFNYYGFVPYSSYTSKDEPATAPMQTLNDFAMRIDWHSLVTPSSTLAYNAGINLRHFGYKSFDYPGYPKLEQAKGAKETVLSIFGGVRMPWDNGSNVGLDANLASVFMSDNEFMSWRVPLPSDGIDLITLPEVGSYAVLNVTPYYRFTRGLLDIRLGADFDFAFNAGPEGSRYSFLHVAPDVKFAIQQGQVGVYLNVLGGTELNTLSRLHELDYYGMPRIISTRPTYSPLDAAFGVNLGPFSGFSIGLEGRYKVAKNVPLGGWYMAWIGNGFAAPAGIKPAVAPTADAKYVDDTDGLNIHGFSLAGRIEYKYGRLFGISAEGTVQPQDGKKGWFNGYDRAKATLNLKLTSSPIEPLTIGAGLDCRMKRNIYMTATAPLGASSSTIINGDNTTIHSLSLPDLTLLNLYASWAFTKDFSVWIQGDNLLNRHDELLPMQHLQGIGVLAGLKVVF